MRGFLFCKALFCLFFSTIRAYSFPDLSTIDDNNLVYADLNKLPSLPFTHIYFVPEIAQGTDIKYELRSATGQLISDRRLCPREFEENGENKLIHKLPANYGISPGLFNEDGDPLDLVVVGREKFYQDMMMTRKPHPTEVRVLGTMLMQECDHIPCLTDAQWSDDWKVVAVDVRDPRYRDVRKIEELPSAVRKDMARYWSHYKGTRNSFPLTRVVGFRSVESSMQWLKGFQAIDVRKRRKQVLSCRDYFQTTRTTFTDEMGHVPFDKTFLNCLLYVFDKDFFKTEKQTQQFLKYSAYQILVGKLKLQDPTLTVENALAVMQKRRDNKELHYRFVSYDFPLPGTLNPIFEWVKTRDTNRGCPKDFPPQHFDRKPLVDLEGITWGVKK